MDEEDAAVVGASRAGHGKTLTGGTIPGYKPKQEQWAIFVASPDCMVTDPDRVLLPTKNFVQGMMNRMTVSYHKYGSFLDIFPHKTTGLANAKLRVEEYKKTGNVEFLIDAANYLMMEACCPSVPDAHFRSTDSDESPGRIDRDGSISHSRNEELLKP